MSVMYGADADELEAFAAELEAYREELGQLLLQGIGAVSLVGLSSTLHTLWRGPRAGEFSALWQSRHLLQVRGVQDLLSDAINDLRTNADQQRVTSRAIGPVGDRPLTPYEKETIDAFADALGKSDAELIAYWNSLDAFQKRILMEREPDWVLSLRPLGILTPEEITAATESYLTNVMDELELEERMTESHISAEVHLKKVEISAEASATVSEIMTAAGPKYIVTLNAEGEVAVGLSSSDGSATVGAGGGLEMKYEFDSWEEANDFVEGVKERLVPDKGDIAHGIFTSPLTGIGGGIAAATLSDVKGYLDDHASERKSSRVKLEVSGDFEADTDGFEAAVEQSTGAFYDTTTGERGIYSDFSGQVAGELGIGLVEAEAGLSVDGKAELVWDAEGRPGQLMLNFEIEGRVGADVGDAVEKLVGPVDDLAGSAGGRASVTTVLDVSNPRNRQLAEAALAGQPGALQELLANSAVGVQLGTVTGVDSEFDFKVGEVNYGSSNYENVATYVKPPQSAMQKM